MERLTEHEKEYYGDAAKTRAMCYMGFDGDCRYPTCMDCIFLKMYRKLGAYEDTGLAPEEITKFYADYNKTLCCETCPIEGSKWIPVAERLPEEWWNGNDEPMEFNVMISGAKQATTLCYNGSQWFEFDWSNMRVAGYYTVTHWQPLPQPPEATP